MWVKFCLPALCFLIGRTKGRNESFLTIRMKIHQNFSSKKKQGLEAMPKFLFVMCIPGIFATVLRALGRCPDVSKN